VGVVVLCGGFEVGPGNAATIRGNAQQESGLTGTAVQTIHSASTQRCLERLAPGKPVQLCWSIPVMDSKLTYCWFAYA